VSALLELAERCEKAPGPDRELWDLDRAIKAALEGREYISFQDDLANRRGTTPPRWTTSLDAAMTRVPEGWGKSVTDADNEQDAIAELWHGDGEGHSHARAKTWPLALCAAALRARAAL